MKKILALVIVLLLLPTLAHAAPTKAIALVDAFAEVAAGSYREGATTDVSGMYQATLYIDVCLSEAAIEAIGATIYVQVSSNTSGDADWHNITIFGGPTSTGTPFKRDILGDEAALQTVLSVDAPVTNNLNHLGKFLFIENTATAANSEIVFQTAVSADADDTITVMDGITNAQAAADGDIWSIDGTESVVAQYPPVNIPDTAVRVRVIYSNILATGTDIFTRCRISDITGI